MDLTHLAIQEQIDVNVELLVLRHDGEPTLVGKTLRVDAVDVEGFSWVNTSWGVSAGRFDWPLADFPISPMPLKRLPTGATAEDPPLAFFAGVFPREGDPTSSDSTRSNAFSLVLPAPLPSGTGRPVVTLRFVGARGSHAPWRTA